MKKNFTLLFALLLFIGYKASYAQTPNWTRVLQATTYGLQQGDVVTADASNVFMAGSISGPITFNGSNFTSVGFRDLIIAKWSNAGIAVWTKQFNAQTSGTIYANAMKVDADQNVYIAGVFTGTATIGSSTITSDASNNAFMAKFDVNGNGLWATSFLSTGTLSSKIAIDGSGNSYLLSGSTKLLKFNSSGVKQWEQSYSDYTLQAIAVYGSNLYIGGALQYGTTTFGTISLASLGGTNTGYLLKADLDGAYTNSLVVGGSTSGEGSSVTDIAMDNSGNLIITGCYTQDLTLGSITITNTDNGYYTYVAKCDNAFSFTWSKSSSALTYSYGEPMWHYRLFIDNSNNIYEYGEKANSLTYGTVPVTSTSGLFLVKFDASGNAISSLEPYYCTEESVYVSPSAKVLYTGSYNYNGSNTYGELFFNSYNWDTSLDWQKNSSASQSGTAKAKYVKHDASGNAYVKSWVGGQVDYFGTTLYSNDEQTVISKLDRDGNVIWSNQIADYYNSINSPQFTLDKDNSILTVGKFDASLNLGTYYFTNLNSQLDGYIVKYNSNGQLSWVVQLETDGMLSIYGITSDASGNVIVTGEFRSQMTILGHTTSAEAVDGAFILKLDANGNYLWLKGYPIGDMVFGAFVSVDSNNNIYLGADIICPSNRIVTLGTVSTPMVNAENTILAKFDPNGNPQWVKTYGTLSDNPNTSASWPDDITTDATGNIFLYGLCKNNANFGASTLTNPIGTTNYSNYLTKINSSGDVVWVKAIYQKYSNDPLGDLLDIDKNNNIYVGGQFKESISIDDTIYSAGGQRDFFVAKYSNSGIFQWLKTIPADVKIINALSVLANDALTVCGSAGKNSTIGSFPITKKGGSSCIVATLGSLDYLDVSTNTLTIAAPANSTSTFDIISDISWTASSNQSWLTLSGSSGSNCATMTLTAEANPTTSTRVATVTVSGTGVASQTVTVTQDAGTTQVNQIYLEESVTIYPNPCNGKFTLGINNFSENDIRVTISNLLGNVVKEFTVKSAPTNYIQDVDLSNQPRGMYFIMIKSNNRKVVKSIVIANP